MPRTRHELSFPIQDRLISAKTRLHVTSQLTGRELRTLVGTGISDSEELIPFPDDNEVTLTGSHGV
jgi:hypothetical protein